MRPSIQSATNICLVAVVLFVFNSCALILSGTKQGVHFDSSPPSVDVYIDGARAGTTPCKIELKKNKEYSIEFRKEGYESRTYRISNSVGAGWIVLDILVGLVPVVIDATTGAWYSLDQESINTILEKQLPK